MHPETESRDDEERKIRDAVVFLPRSSWPPPRARGGRRKYERTVRRVRRAGDEWWEGRAKVAGRWRRVRLRAASWCAEPVGVWMVDSDEEEHPDEVVSVDAFRLE